MSELVSAQESASLDTAGMILLRVFVQAYLATAHEKPERRARAYLQRASGLLEDEMRLSAVVPIRATAAARGLAEERRRAREIFDQLEPLFVASLPPPM